MKTERGTISNENIKEGDAFLCINECPRHGFLSISIDTWVVGTTLAGGSCCGYSERRWSRRLDKDAVKRIVLELKRCLKKVKS